MSSFPAIQFFTSGTRISLKDREALKRFLQQLAKREGRKLASLTYIFCSDEYLLQMNRQFLQHDYYTDIITFDLSEPGSSGIAGEIYISADRVRDNARQFGTTIKQELHRVIFHGILHLCGYGDKSAKQQSQMRKKEEEYLNRYFSA